MEPHEIEELIVRELNFFGRTNEAADILIHYRKMNLSLPMICILIQENVFIDYILNTYDWACSLIKRGIDTNWFYKRGNKTPKTNFVAFEAEYPKTVSKASMENFWNDIYNRYIQYLKQLI